MKRNLWWIILLIGLLSSACGPYKHQCGIQYNAERQKIGLPVILNNWRAEDAHLKECTWYNPDREVKFKNHVPVHWSKYVSFREDQIVSESDEYYGLRDYIFDESTSRESVFITYYYPNDGSSPKWEVTLWTPETRDFGNSRISLEKADEILREWGIDRLADSTPRP